MFEKILTLLQKNNREDDLAILEQSKSESHEDEYQEPSMVTEKKLCACGDEDCACNNPGHVCQCGHNH